MATNLDIETNQSTHTRHVGAELGTAAVEQIIPEILAPVGGREQFFAALNSGADSVFLGLQKFNARSRAENFSVEDLESLVPIAHRYGMKVLVTMNILIKEEELPEVIQTLADLERISVDAVIVQDLGVARMIRRHFPGLRMHASTQLAVHNLAGVMEAARLGFKRVVLARELTAEEIKRISRVTDIELEVFCHGSLCYSYSGLCFFSGAADSRSGNRGECAYTCREPYKVVSEPGHGFLFSMRDLDTSHKLDQMVLAGVHALKIEGRKKDAQYVSSVVKLYRKKLDEHFKRPTLRDNAPPMAKEGLPAEATIRKDMQLSFQRQTTSFFFEGRYHENVIDLNSPTHHGVRVGVVEKIRGQSIEVVLEDDLEKYDGLKIIPMNKLYHAKPQDGDSTQGSLEDLARRYENRELAFSLRDMSFKGRRVFEAQRGMRIEIVVPGASKGLSVGDVLYKARSNNLKTRVERLSGVPVGERLRPMIPIQMTISMKRLDDGAVAVHATVLRSGEQIASASNCFSQLAVREKGDLISDIKDVFTIFGDQGVYCESLAVRTDAEYFVAKSVLKDLKKQLGADLKSSIERLHSTRAAKAQGELSVSDAVRDADSAAVFSIKIDRLDYLPWICEVASKSHIAEVIFEPKKMFLPGVKPEMFLAPLKEFQAASGIKVRLAVPTVVRAWDEPLLELWFKAAWLAGFQSYEVGNIGAFELLRRLSLPCHDIVSDFTLYAMNQESAKQLAELGVSRAALSIEDDSSGLAGLLGAWPQDVTPEVILYKDTPLFVAEACSLTALHNGCPSSKVCGYRTLEIENSKGERFHVAHEGCKSIVYGDKAYSISGQRQFFEDLGVRRFRVDALTRPYTKEQFTSLLMNVLSDDAIANTHTANFKGRLK
jgi:putative protease